MRVGLSDTQAEGPYIKQKKHGTRNSQKKAMKCSLVMKCSAQQREDK